MVHEECRPVVEFSCGTKKMAAEAVEAMPVPALAGVASPAAPSSIDMLRREKNTGLPHSEPRIHLEELAFLDRVGLRL